jgi:hypothetical protein
MRIVPSLDELEDIESGFSVRPVGASVDPFTLQGSKEAFAHRIVKAVSD